MHLISLHPVVCVAVAYWLFSAFVGGMPEPNAHSGLAYVWLHNSLQLLAGNLSKVIAVRYPSIAGVTVPKLEASGELGTLWLFASSNFGYLTALRNYLSARFPLRRAHLADPLSVAAPMFAAIYQPLPTQSGDTFMSLAFFTSAEHAVATVAHEVVVGATAVKNSIEKLGATVAKDAPTIEALTALVDPRAAQIERLGAALIGTLEPQISKFADDVATLGAKPSVALTQDLVAELKALYASLKSEITTAKAAVVSTGTVTPAKQISQTVNA